MKSEVSLDTGRSLRFLPKPEQDSESDFWLKTGPWAGAGVRISVFYRSRVINFIKFNFLWTANCYCGEFKAMCWIRWLLSCVDCMTSGTSSQNGRCNSVSCSRNSAKQSERVGCCRWWKSWWKAFVCVEGLLPREFVSALIFYFPFSACSLVWVVFWLGWRTEIFHYFSRTCLKYGRRVCFAPRDGQRWPTHVGVL